MHTRHLIDVLASDARPVRRHAVATRLAWSTLTGIGVALILLLTFGGMRGDLPDVLDNPVFWLKSLFPASVATAALLLAARLGRPGARTRSAWLLLALPVLAVWFAAGWVLESAPPSLRMPLLLGQTWRVCCFNILALSVPTFIATFWAVRGLAPTRLTLAGMGAGILAGAQAVLVYTLYCTEMAAPFWATWYVLGMALPTVLGALLGPRLLRW
ncbi:DUF1109 domain-containing protein [Luteibacter aegosomatis]|uniref:DUF1109 domain-containing protein n=1 Tax=Luteibacter aegosomatis TaxID=2911537 RepID=UPI001FF78765|nr:DUF1109 domain-containing protein [Luteibacter aegosomatis]UPG85321.1 DUF1109 domain-containing protein [Luteibacter aegosomatis]